MSQSVRPAQTARERHSFCYGDTILDYTLFRRTQGKNKVRITVSPEGEVMVAMAESIPLAQVEDIIRRRARWILETREKFFSQRHFAVRYRYVSGETHFYLGKKYQLHITDTSQGIAVKLKNGKFLVPSKFPWSSDEETMLKRAEEVKTRLQTWYKARAESLLKQRLETLCKIVPWCTSVPPYCLRFMKKRWGSCSSSGSLILNPLLVRASSECIDYVILHELCHLKIHNHSNTFWMLLTQVCPDWKMRKATLDAMAEIWIGRSTIAGLPGQEG